MRIWKFVAIALVTVVGLTAVTLSDNNAQAVDDNSSLVHRAESEVRKPKTDGTYVVWADRVSAGQWDVYGSNLSTGDVFPIAAGGGASRSDRDVDSGIVVWSEGSETCPNCERDILGMSLDSSEGFNIASGGADQTRPAISDGIVVWVEDDGEDFPALRVASLENPDQAVTLSTRHALITRPEIDGQRVVWVEQRGFYSEREYRLVTQEIGDHEATIIEDFDSDLRIRSADSPFAIAGSSIFYSSAEPGLALVRYDISTGESRPVVPSHPASGNLSTDGRYVFGHDGPSLQRGVRLRIWDTQVGASFLAPSDVTESGADIQNGIVVWERGGQGGMRQEVHSRPITQLLPTTPQPRPADLDPDTDFHDATGHPLGGRFLNFWRESGGLPVFGHPLSTEYSELNPDTEDMHTVQYFERQRYEFHPNNIDTPYEVQLGRLGFDEAQRRGLLDTDAFQSNAERPYDDSNCDEFDVTGFVVCNEFLDYWQSHGLDFGDDDISYRESLALFGYPISQPYVDDETGLLTQYFERARFELHPDNPEEYRVLLGRLGADLLDQRDW